MSDTETIRSFLISLGFKIDETSETKFKTAIDGATKLAFSLGAAVVAAATAVGVATAKMASDFDNLYFASQRTKASVEDIKAFGYAVSQLGGTSDAAASSLESFARKMREMPALRDQVNQFTGSNIGRDGKVTLETLEKIGDWFRTQPEYMRQNMAGVWGFDEKTMLAMTAGVDKFAAHYKKIQRDVGLDPQTAAENGNKLMTAWRSIWNTFTTIVEGALAKLLGPGGENLTALGNWFDAHAKEISDALAEIGKGFLEAFAGWKDGLGNVDWKEVGKGVAEFAKDIGHLVANLRDLTKWAVDAAKAVNKFGQDTGLEWLLNKLAYYGPPNEHQGTGGPTDAGAGDGEKPGFFRRAWDRTKRAFGLGAEAKPYAGNSGEHVSPQGAMGGKSNAHFTKENADSVRTAAKELGTTPEDLATVIGYESGFNPSKWGGKGGNYLGLIQFGPSERAQFGVNEHQSFPEQMKAAVSFLKARGFKPGMGLLDLYSTILTGSPGHYNRSDGHGTVLTHVEKMKAERAAQARRFLQSGADAHHAGGLVSHRAAHERAGRHHDAPASTFNPSDAWGAYRRTHPANAPTAERPYMQAPPPGTQSFNNNSSSSSAALHANTTINIHGGADAGQIAQSVAANQSRVNANLIRNLQGAVA